MLAHWCLSKKYAYRFSRLKVQFSCPKFPNKQIESRHPRTRKRKLLMLHWTCLLDCLLKLVSSEQVKGPGVEVAICKGWAINQ